jgi:hypothetical protein
MNKRELERQGIKVHTVYKDIDELIPSFKLGDRILYSSGSKEGRVVPEDKFFIINKGFVQRVNNNIIVERYINNQIEKTIIDERLFELIIEKMFLNRY